MRACSLDAHPVLAAALAKLDDTRSPGSPVPRPGGAADKLGNRYELAWAIRHALLCLRDDESRLTLEDIDPDLARGSEFTFVPQGGAPSVHQVKRQHGNKNYWTIAALADRGVFSAARGHVDQGREYHFSSLVPTGSLRELAERARVSDSLDQFREHQLTQDLGRDFAELSGPRVFGDSETAWLTLRGMRFAVREEDDTARQNGVLAEQFLQGATGPLMAIAVGAVLLDNLGVTLTRDALLEGLTPYGITGLSLSGRQEVSLEVAAVTRSWRKTVQRELLDPPIERTESAEVINALSQAEIVLVVGAAGGGKSSVVCQAVEALDTGGATVLAFRLDRLGAFTSTVGLGTELGLSMSPAAALAIAARSNPAFLVIDQLDAVSLASGRMSERYDVIADLIAEATSLHGVRVVLVCRKFDVDNDHRIRKLDARDDVQRLTVSELPDTLVAAAVERMGLDSAALTATQRGLLRSPLNLVLLSGIAGQPNALSFGTTDALFEAFWERKRQQARQRRADIRFNDVLAVIANAASDRQALWVPIELLDAEDLIEHANVLISEQVLARDGQRIAFFHESFFDYTFARQWMTREQSMIDFLSQSEQELFRRAQVRQVMQVMHEHEPGRFRLETEAVLSSPAVRFHVKDVVIAVLSGLPEPSSQDAQLILRVLAKHPTFEKRLWLQLSLATWFMRFNELGLISQWLESDNQELKDRAVSYMASAVTAHPDDVLRLLDQLDGSSDYIPALRWLAQVTHLHEHRPLLEIVLKAVEQGLFDDKSDALWLATHDLAKHRPIWAIELLKAKFIVSPEAMTLTAGGEVAALKAHDYGGSELIREAAAAEPIEFVETVVLLLLNVMAATQMPQHLDNLIGDPHFSLRLPRQEGDDREFDDALFAASSSALENLARTAPDAVRPILGRLANEPYDAAQFLLYRALTAGAGNFSSWAAELLLQGGNRLDCGYVSDSRWVARELLRAISSLVDDEVHLRLEEAVRDLRNPYEQRRNFGYTAFSFLSALDERRLSAIGTRRLGEYRRKFGKDSPAAPRGIEMTEVVSPISRGATQKMSDDQWLRAMAKHNNDDDDWHNVGGARELSHALKERVKEDPARFAHLALRITDDTNPTYAGAILWGFGECSPRDQDADPMFEAIRYLASLGFDETDRWLGYSLQQLRDRAPLDLVNAVLKRALNASDPTRDREIFTNEGGARRRDRLYENGINTARGHLAEALGDLVVHDTDGTRTEIVRPHLPALASDHVLCVRACVAHTIAACLQYARPSAYRAFDLLVDADDVLLASHHVQDLMIYIGNRDPDHVTPVIRRMLASSDDEARQAGGSLAAYAALQWDKPELMDAALSGDSKIRQGAAHVCSARIDRPTNLAMAKETLIHLMFDDDPEVRGAVGELAGHLRDKDLTPFEQLLKALIASPSYTDASPQLLITLQHAVTRVDELVMQAAERFVSVYGTDAADIRTGAAGDAHYIAELVIRGLAQSDDVRHRAMLLDVLDRLLEMGVYGVVNALTESDRH